MEEMKIKPDESYKLDGTVRTIEEKVKLIVEKNIDIGLFNVSDFVEKLWYNYKILRNRNLIREFDFEKWLREQTDSENPDTTLLFNITKDNEIVISDYNDNYRYVIGKTLQEACEKWSEKK